MLEEFQKQRGGKGRIGRRGGKKAINT